MLLTFVLLWRDVDAIAIKTQHVLQGQGAYCDEFSTEQAISTDHVANNN